MTDLKYQPLKASEGCYQIWLLFFYAFAERMADDFSLQRVRSVQNFAYLMIGIFPMVDENLGQVKDRNDIGAKIYRCICCKIWCGQECDIFWQIEAGLKKQWGCTGPSPGTFNAPLLDLFLLLPLNVGGFLRCFHKYGHRIFLNKLVHSSWLFGWIAIVQWGNILMKQ